MGAPEFENTLRQLVHARPFRPFVFVMKDGEMIMADAPNAVSFGTASATCVTSEPEVFLLDCDDVQEIRLVVTEAVR